MGLQLIVMAGRQVSAEADAESTCNAKHDLRKTSSKALRNHLLSLCGQDARPAECFKHQCTGFTLQSKPTALQAYRSSASRRFLSSSASLSSCSFFLMRSFSSRTRSCGRRRGGMHGQRAVRDVREHDNLHGRFGSVCACAAWPLPACLLFRQHYLLLLALRGLVHLYLP